MHEIIGYDAINCRIHVLDTTAVLWYSTAVANDLHSYIYINVLQNNCAIGKTKHIYKILWFPTIPNLTNCFLLIIVIARN